MARLHGVGRPLSWDSSELDQRRLTGDGHVDGADYTVWADHYATVLSASAVPEPSTLARSSASAQSFYSRTLSGDALPSSMGEPGPLLTDGRPLRPSR